MYQEIGKHDVGRILGQQLLRSGTSIGANVEEAQAAHSDKDFLFKMTIALKEARETRYWLLLLKDSAIFPAAKFDEILDEVEQLIRIIYTITRNTKQNMQ
ncbi:MAG: four helix bundle protein [Anaerolineales bacterium]|nr:four helix bundle protein [Anaerolineales bacterium]